jgi:peptide chain release factor 1
VIDESRLEEVVRTYEELTSRLADPETAKDYEEFKRLSKKRAEIEPLVQAIQRYEATKSELADAREMIHTESDEEMKAFLRDEIARLENQLSELEEEIKILLIGTDPRDTRNVIIEIRAGTGGEEASLFASDLFRMYTRYAERQRWNVEVLSESESDMGGYKEVIFEVKGKNVYSKMKYESGVHRVQRVPETESQGRIHTSTATVAVLPEAEEVDVHIDPKDLKIDTFRSSGAGGQHVNVTDSAVRITHLPTGIVVSCQQERSQIQNREKALMILRTRLYEHELRRQQEEIARQRKQQVGTGERSEKIRTYNFPQNRVTDHRIGLTLYNLEAILDGEIDELIEALAAHERAEKLKQAI